MKSFSVWTSVSFFPICGQFSTPARYLMVDREYMFFFFYNWADFWHMSNPQKIFGCGCSPFSFILISITLKHTFCCHACLPFCPLVTPLPQSWPFPLSWPPCACIYPVQMTSQCPRFKFWWGDSWSLCLTILGIQLGIMSCTGDSWWWNHVHTCIHIHSLGLCD